jgi:hypothetical protein
MKSVDPEEMKELSLLWKRGIELMGDQQGTRKSIRDQLKSDAGNLVDAHMFAFAIAANAVMKKDSVPGKASKSIDERLSLVASFILGVDITEVSIAEGLYVQAAALLKQELETITAIGELVEDRRRDRRTPNIGNSGFPWMKRVYSDLNAAAHVGDAEVLRGLVSRRISEEVAGAALHPLYNRDLSIYFYGLHVILIVLLALQIEDLHDEMYGERFTERENRTLLIVQAILEELGWLDVEKRQRAEEE